MKNPFTPIPYEGDVQAAKGEGSKGGDENHVRGNWGSQLDFTLSCIGYAVGLGNLWRFPYLCMRNGGGAFLVPYFTFLFLCGMPMFYLELVIGQFSSSSPLSVWRLCPLFKGLGWGMMVVSGIICIYYNVIICWILYYLGMSFTKELPWASCNNTWNTEKCVERVGGAVNMSKISAFVYNESNVASPLGYVLATTASSANLTNITARHVTPAEEFWHNNVLGISEGIEHFGGLKWQLVLCLLAAWVIVFLCLIKGVKSSGKVVYVTATLPYVILTILLIRGLLLPGSYDGVMFFLKPEWGRLKEFKVWGEACLQIFYSLGPAWGGLITMASYNRFNNNCRNDAIIVCIACSGTSFYAGFVIFSIIGFMARQADVAIGDVITAGPGLAFVAYPEALTQLPISPLWAVLFFLMLLTLGLDSQFATLETVISGIVDEWPRFLQKRKMIFTVVVCVVQFFFGFPFVTRGGMYLFQVVDWYCAAFSVMVIALMECLVVSYIYGVNRLCYDIEMMIGHQPSWYWKIMWSFVTPIILIVILIFSSFRLTEPTYGDYEYPRWAIAMGWVLATCSIAPIPIVAIYRIIRQPGTFNQRLAKLLQPAPEWGPALPEFRAVYKFNSTPIYKIPLDDMKNANYESKQPLKLPNGEPPSYDDV